MEDKITQHLLKNMNIASLGNEAENSDYLNLIEYFKTLSNGTKLLFCYLTEESTYYHNDYGDSNFMSDAADINNFSNFIFYDFTEENKKYVYENLFDDKKNTSYTYFENNIAQKIYLNKIEKINDEIKYINLPFYLSFNNNNKETFILNAKGYSRSMCYNNSFHYDYGELDKYIKNLLIGNKQEFKTIKRYIVDTFRMIYSFVSEKRANGGDGFRGFIQQYKEDYNIDLSMYGDEDTILEISYYEWLDVISNTMFYSYANNLTYEEFDKESLFYYVDKEHDKKIEAIQKRAKLVEDNKFEDGYDYLFNNFTWRLKRDADNDYILFNK